ncbi:MAG: acyltransferase, partial [Bacteroidota bacterium]
ELNGTCHEFGGSGVHLFFMLSGFGLLMSKKQTLINFYKRRFTKVYLPYFLVLTICLLTNFLIPIYPNDGVEAYLAGIFLYQMFYEGFMEAFGGHFWFISAIIQFYLLFPLISWCHQKLGDRIFLLISTLISIAYWCLLYGMGYMDIRNWAGSFLQFLWVFSFGMVMASQYRQRQFKFWDYPMHYYILIAIVSISIAAVSILKLGLVGKAFNDIPVFFGYTALCVIAYKLILQSAPRLIHFFEKTGDYSYSIYLTHALVITLALYSLEVASIDRNFWIVLSIVPIILLASWIYEKISVLFTRYILKLFALY